MNTEILSADKDPMGAAILDFQQHGKAARLRVLSSMFEEDEMPVKHLFRSTREMPMLEQKALQLAKGRVLDIGAGAGCHALALQEKGLAVKAIDISPLSCEAMKLRGVKDAECINLFDPHLSSGNHSGENQEQFEGGFDTILLLMNGTGIAGKIENLPALFLRLKALLNPGGQILIDSSDLKYIYENEDGSFDINLNGAYYGEVDYQMIYKNVKGDRFDWLYVDFPLLKSIAETCGLHGELVEEGEHYDYLARFF
ncbi:class I SAM-dependent methyltransferase [Prevotella copri]|jgi:putative methyltransferase|uniref:Class I SAM-dependent methyltransferase n=1 Tax=Segatella copri TaxID=165179 RepID=A0A6G1U556_9BACT|nr:methyltransferase domain-containing protein [Segatella copri]MBV3401917.1 class I SAM-dependent methyltransferase [Segatella copri]MQN81958.1 class I SAM-dependent methyltransferase [Segatella copri]